MSAQAELRTHIGHVAEVWAETPTGRGLLPTAVAEADIALQHARLAREDSLSLVGMRRHASHVMHALDPSVVSGVGPGLGFGVSRGAGEAVRHMELSVTVEAPSRSPFGGVQGDPTDSLSPDPADSLALPLVSENVAVHVPRILEALAGAVQRTDQAIALAERIQTAASVADALPLVDRLVSLCHAIRWGTDANRDGIVDWRLAEGGLAQATYHLNLLRRGEGFSP